MSASSTAPAGRWLTLAALCAILLLTVLLRLPGLHWLVHAGPSPDYSFMTDDQRFVDLAKNVRAGMPDGYVYGMTSQALALRTLTRPFLGETNILQLLRVVSIGYATLTVLLVFAITRAWVPGEARALLAAAFLAFAPVHVATSNFGTADVTAVFYFYLTIYVQSKYLRDREPLFFVLSALLTGAAIAVKLFLPLLVPLIVLVAMHRGRQLLTQALIALAAVYAGFELFSLFAYTPWDLANLFAALHREVLAVPNGHGLIAQLVLYGWDLLTALNVPVAAVFFAGIAWGVLDSRRRLGEWFAARAPDGDWRRLITPQLLLVATLGVQGLLIISAGIHAVRHLLVFVPVACMIAARTLTAAAAHYRWSRVSCVLGAVALIGYGIANAAALEALFIRDIRSDLAAWSSTAAAEGKTVLSLRECTPVTGTTFDLHADPLAMDANTYVVSCDLEFNTYLRSPDARTYAPFGGQKRTDFYWGVFKGSSPYRVVRTFHQSPMSLEQALIDRQWLRPVGTFVPKTCLALGRDGGNGAPPPASLWPHRFYTTGW